MAIVNETITRTISVSGPVTYSLNNEVVSSVSCFDVLIDSIPGEVDDSIQAGIGCEATAFTSAMLSVSAVSGVVLADILTYGSISVEEIIDAINATSALSSVATLNLIVTEHVRVDAAVQKTPTPETWVMNAATKAFSRYDGYRFQSFFTHQGNAYGVTATGIYLLDGPDDAGLAIDAFVMLGKDDFGSPELKRVPYVYVGAQSDNGLSLTVLMPDGKSYDYSIPKSDTLRTQRAKLGNGLRARYWQFVLRNVDGGGFSIESMELLATQQGRKLNG